MPRTSNVRHAAGFYFLRQISRVQTPAINNWHGPGSCRGLRSLQSHLSRIAFAKSDGARVRHPGVQTALSCATSLLRVYGCSASGVRISRGTLKFASAAPRISLGVRGKPLRLP